MESYFVLQLSYQSESFIYVRHFAESLLVAVLVYGPVKASDLLSFYGLRCPNSVPRSGISKRCLQAFRMSGNQLEAEIIISVSAPQNQAGYVYRSKF
jgi:hypothetical protein